MSVKVPDDSNQKVIESDDLSDLVWEGSSNQSGDDVIQDCQTLDATNAVRKMKWTPMLYRRPIVPIAGMGRSCPNAMTASSLVAFREQQKLVLFGGVVGTVPNNKTWLYSIPQKKWCCLQEGSLMATSKRTQEDEAFSKRKSIAEVFPPPRCGHCAAVVSSTEMIVFGGADMSTSTYYNDLWCFDILTYTWKMMDAGGIKPRPRWMFAMASVESRVFIHGGETSQYELLEDLQVYEHDPEGEFIATILTDVEPESLSTIIQQSIATDSAKGSACSVFGKRGYRVVDLTVTAQQSPPSVAIRLCVDTKMSQTSVSVIHELISTITGCDMSCFVGIRGARRTWMPLRTIYPSPPARMMHSGVAISDSIVMVGGSGDHQTSDVWLLESRSLIWKEIKTTPVPGELFPKSPFHLPNGNIGTLTGHVITAYDNIVIIHGGKLDGKLCGENLWLLDLTTGCWCLSDVVLPEGAKKGDKTVVPSARWKHAVCAMVHIDETILMDNSRALSSSSSPSCTNDVYPLGEQEISSLRAILAQERQELRLKSNYVGLLCSEGNIPHMKSTLYCVIWGGANQNRKSSDLWMLQLVKEDTGQV